MLDIGCCLLDEMMRVMKDSFLKWDLKFCFDWIVAEKALIFLKGKCFHEFSSFPAIIWKYRY